MAPIRIGIIGLSATGSWAVNSHLPYLRQATDKYTIVALCNSSKKSAQAAKEAFSLPSSVKTYGSPEELATDPDVELVLVSVRVDKHYAAIKPVVAAGKDVFCEWPLAKNYQEAEELTKLAKEKNVKTIVGLQDQFAPWVHKVEELLKNEAVGKVYSSTVVAAGHTLGPSTTEAAEYIADWSVGGNMFTICGGHVLGAILGVLGDFESFQSLIGNQRKVQNIVDAPDGKVLRTIPINTHDHVFIQGRLKSGALLSFNQRGSRESTLSFLWTIYGEKGEIEIVVKDGFSTFKTTDGIEIKVHDHTKSKAEPVVVDLGKDHWESLPLPARNMAPLYEAFAKGDTKGYLDWSAATKQHKLIRDVYEQNGVTE